MPFPDLPPERIPGSPGHLNDHQLIDQALDYIQQSGYRDDPNFPPLPDIPVLGQSGHVTAHDRILAILEYIKQHPAGGFTWAQVSNTPTGTYKGDDGYTYAYYTFTTSGTLTVTTAGLLDVLAVSGGGGSYVRNDQDFHASLPGVGGYIVTGLHPFDADSHAVTVGAGGSKGTFSSGPTVGQASSVGPCVTGRTSYGFGSAGPTTNKPYASTITGDTLLVSGVTGQGGQYGAGGTPGASGQNGVVIVRTRLN